MGRIGKTGEETHRRPLRERRERADDDGVWTGVAQRSYLISRAVHWWQRVEIKPRLRIPVPRAFTYRDP